MHIYFLLFERIHITVPQSENKHDQLQYSLSIHAPEQSQHKTIVH